MTTSPFDKFASLSFVRCELNQQHSQLVGTARVIGDLGDLGEESIFLLTVLDRSCAVNRGLLCLVNDRNWHCSVPLLRMQADNLLRMFAVFYLPKGSELIKLVLFDGKKLSDLKDHNGTKLTDRRLMDIFTKACSSAWIDDVYRETSRTVHLSSRHLMRVIRKFDDSELSVIYSVSGRCDDWQEHEILDLLTCLREITEIIIAVSEWWIFRRRRERASRPTPD